MLLPARTIQKNLKIKADGIIGPHTVLAARHILPSAPSWSNRRVIVAYCQLLLWEWGFDAGPMDGLVGPQTLWALEQYQNKSRDYVHTPEEVEHQSSIWPRQKDVPKFFGNVGESQTFLELPYPMKLAWDKDVIIHRISLHEKVIESAGRAFENILKEYGSNMVSVLGLDLYGGGFNVRKMRGGTKYSMHSWGIAIDFNPEQNHFRWTSGKASLAGTDFIPFWEIWEKEGWISLGREKNYDWMHVQAARL